jgi:hypothetical protein
MKPSIKKFVEMPKNSVILLVVYCGPAIGLIELFSKCSCPKVSQALICEDIYFKELFLKLSYDLKVQSKTYTSKKVLS